MTKLWAEWPCFDSWLGQGRAFFYHRVQTGSGTHSASYPVGVAGEVVGAWNWTLISI